jgi:Fe-S-cluster containining protein
VARKLEIINMMAKEAWDTRSGDELWSQVDHSLNPCERCLSKCCTKTVHLSALEAALISQTLSMPFSSFLVTEPWEDNEDFIHTGVMPYHRLDLDTGPSRLTLRKRDDSMCVFVFFVDGRGRCGNYAQRPGICRLYPAAFYEDGVHRWVGGTDLCGERWLFDESTPAKLLRELERWHDDVARDETLCAEWNDPERDKRSLDDAGAFFTSRLS